MQTVTDLWKLVGTVAARAAPCRCMLASEVPRLQPLLDMTRVLSVSPVVGLAIILQLGFSIVVPIAGYCSMYNYSKL